MESPRKSWSTERADAPAHMVRPLTLGLLTHARSPPLLHSLITMRGTDLRAARCRRPSARWLLLVLLLSGTLQAQPPRPAAYDLKAAFLYNFLEYVEWPAPADAGPLVVCVAGQNPFGSAFDAVMTGTVNGRTLQPRVILGPDPDCHAIFVPRTANIGAYLRAARDTPTLLVGETPGFLDQGGIINFVSDGSRLRFAIGVAQAQRVGLRIHPNLLRLRVADTGGPV